MCRKRLCVSLGVGALLSGVVGCQSADRATYGAQFSSRSAEGVTTAIDTADGAAKTVVVQGQITEVCQKRGCWMRLQEGEHEILVRFTASAQCADGYFVPRNAMGHRAWVKGTLEKTVLSEADARHYAEDEGKPAAEIAQIVGPQPVYSLIATGVTIEGASTLEPAPQ